MKMEKVPERPSFENFKSTMCHRVKEMGDMEFIIDLLRSDDIHVYYDRQWYPECFYMLGMLDYLSGINDLPVCTNYNDLRNMKLEEPLFPSSIIAKSVAAGNDDAKEKALKEAIPEFLRFNIVESGVRDVV